MQRPTRAPAYVFAAISAAVFLPAHAADTDLIERLGRSKAVNIEFIIDRQFEHTRPPSGFRVMDPYAPDAIETVLSWNESPLRDTAVCAVRFIDAGRIDYELRNFGSASEAHVHGFTVTHQGRCGACSTLQDLAVYLAETDLTTPARQCARRLGLKGKKRCFRESIGFTPWCAESWAYNAANTRRECLGVCISDYGLFNLLVGRYPGPNTDESGQLRPCLQCDEDSSGPGFKFSAGRTRRNSGIVSAIERPESELYSIDHTAYFR